MTDWFDPQTWLRQLPDPLNVRGLIQGGTAAWLNEVTSLARNRPVEIRRDGHSIRGTVRSIKLYPPAAPPVFGSVDAGFDALDRALLVVDDVDWRGRRIDRVRAIVEDLRVGTQPTSHIRGGPVTLDITLPLSTVADWLAESRISVRGAGVGPGELRVSSRWRRLSLVADVLPAATSRSLVLMIRRLWLGGRVVPLPRSFDLSLSVPIDLSPGVRLRQARLVDEDTVAIEAQIQAVDYPIGVQQVLDALAGSGPTVLDLAPG